MNKLMKTCLSLSAIALAASACADVEVAPETDEPTADKVAEAARRAVVYHSTWNGASADAWAWSPYQSISMQAWENKSQGGLRTAYLSLWGYSVDPTSEVCHTEQWCWGNDADGGAPDCYEYTWCEYTRYSWIYGWGEISESDFRVSGSVKTAHLDVDLAQAPGFTATRCTYDTVANSYDCAAFDEGAVDVIWSANGFYSSSQNGVQSNQYGNYTERTTGQYDSASADTSGTVLGVPARGQGYISTSKGVGVSKEIL